MKMLKRKQEAGGGLSLALPTKKTAPPTNLSSYKIFLFGHQKIGKTSLTAQFEDALHFFFEPSGTDYELYAVEPTSWEQFVGYLDLLEEQKATGELSYKNFIVDVVDLAYEQCLKYVCGKQGLDYPPTNDFGRTWRDIKDEFRTQITRLARLGGAVFISHVKEVSIEKANGFKYDRFEPSCAKGAFEVLSKWCDLTAFYRASTDDEGNRELVITPSREIEAGNRMETRFKYTDGSQIDVIDMGKSAQESMANFMRAFKNETVNPSEKEATPKKRLKKKQQGAEK